MKTTNKGLLLGSLVCMLALPLTGCSDSSTSSNFPAGVAGSTSVAQSQTIPTGGGTISLPSNGGITASLAFAAGAPANDVIILTDEVNAPSNAPAATGLSAANATTSPFYYVGLTVSQPTPLSLLSSISLSGDVPPSAEQYDVELDDSTGFLEEIPGSATNTTGNSMQASFKPLPGNSILEPGTNYVLQFKSTTETLLPVTFINSANVTTPSGDAAPVYFSIIGKNPMDGMVVNGKTIVDNQFYHVTNDNPPRLVPVSYSDSDPATVNQNPPIGIGPANGLADYNIPVPADGKFLLPLVKAGRIYISVGAKMQIQLNNTSISDPQSTPPIKIADPNAWSNTSDKNYNTLFDWVEFDYKLSPDTQKPSMGINKTEVQMFSLPLQITLAGPTIDPVGHPGEGQTAGTNSSTRALMFAALTNDTNWQSVVINATATNTLISPLRMVSPDTAQFNYFASNGAPTFNPTYFDKYIDDVWTLYTPVALGGGGLNLTLYTDAYGPYVGSVNAQNQMIFTQAGKASLMIPKPTPNSLDTWSIGTGNHPSVPNGAPNYFGVTSSVNLIIGNSLIFEIDTPGATPIPILSTATGATGPLPGGDTVSTNTTDAVAGELASSMSAAFNRSTLLLENFITRDYANHPATLSNFYLTNPPAPAKPQTVSLYAKVIHQYSLPLVFSGSGAGAQPATNAPGGAGGGAAYAFGFDDNSNQSSVLIENSGPTALNITIPAF